jgi:hypothetical protein
LAKNVKKTLEMKLRQVQVEREQEKERTGRIKKQMEEVFKTISESTKGGNIPTKEKIEKITHDMEAYRSHITKLKNLLSSPSTPPELRTQRE